MPELSTPIWLSGLVTIPLIWWLHHYRRLGTSTKVSALLLWQGHSITQGTNIQRTQIDPGWRIRALAACMLVLGLAGPFWLAQSTRAIEIWFDDSISMQTLEDGVPRATLAIDAVLDALPRGLDHEVTIRSLVDVSRSLKLVAGQRHTWRSSIEEWIRPGTTLLLLPTPQQMNTHHEHWLVSDGADPSIGAWLEEAPVRRLIHVGEYTENVALTRLSLRPSLARPGTHSGLLIVHNVGHETASRHIEIRTDGQTIKTIDITIPAGESVNLPFQLNGLQDGTVRAVMTPPDALPIDDELNMEIETGGKISATLAGACGPHLRKALQAHPNLQFIDKEHRPALVISCGAKQPHSGNKVLWMHTAQATRPLPTGSSSSAPLWHPDAGTLRKLTLNPLWLKRFEISREDHRENHLYNKGTPLLVADGIPLVNSYQPIEPMIEVLLDLESPQLVRRPEYPLLIAGLIDEVLNRSSLDTIRQTGRSPQESVIAPANLTIAGSPQNSGAQVIGKDLSFFFILAAGLLLLLDFLRGLRGPLSMATAHPRGRP